jgi:PKD repeat protein
MYTKNRISTFFLIVIAVAAMAATMKNVLPAYSTSPQLLVVPSSIVDQSLGPGSTFTVNASVTDIVNLVTWQVKIFFDPTILNCTNAWYPADHVFAGKPTQPVTPSIDNTIGYVTHGNLVLSGSYNGSGTLCQINFTVLSRGNCALEFSTPYGASTFLWDPDDSLISVTVTDGYFDNRLPAPPPPVASFDYSPTTIIVGHPVTFNGSSSYAPGGTVVSWNWDFGDGGTGSGSIAGHTYSSAGSYVVNLTVTDSNALTNSTEETVSVYAFQPAELYIDPAQIIDLSLGPTSTFYVNVTLTAVASLGVCQFNLTYDPQVLNWIGIELMPIPQYPTATMTVASGSLAVNLNYVSVSVTGEPTPLVRVHFSVNAYGISQLNLTDINLLDSQGNPIPCTKSDGLFINIIRDVAVTNVVPASSWIYQGFIDNVNVTVANLGNLTETFSVSAWYNSTIIGTMPVNNLPHGAQTTVDIAWNTTGVPQGNYTITGTASLVPYESYFNTTNNVYVDGTVQVLALIHDVAITDVTPTLSWAYVNLTVPINVTASNLGNVSESFSVTAYDNGSAISTIPVTNLANGTSTVLTFNWNTSGLAEGKYTISANASTVPFEYNTANNYLADGDVQILTAIRDVEIINVAAASAWSNTWTYQGATVNVTVTAKNDGETTESFYVTAYYNSNLLGNVSVTNLASGDTIAKVFAWNTTTATPNHNYTISGQASLIPFEFNTTNNVLTDGTLDVRFVGDVNGDGKVDMKDIREAAKAFGSYGPNYAYPGSPPSARWNKDYDITGSKYLVPDNVIDMRDIRLIAVHFGNGV